jgi:hypothetical protein
MTKLQQLAGFKRSETGPDQGSCEAERARAFLRGTEGNTVDITVSMAVGTGNVPNGVVLGVQVL